MKKYSTISCIWAIRPAATIPIALAEAFGSKEELKKVILFVLAGFWIRFFTWASALLHWVKCQDKSISLDLFFGR